MATFHIEQFGCRATQADAAAIERQLRDRGYQLSDSAASADVVVVNTCTVTASADAQARAAIRGLTARNPGARIVVTGCYAQRAPEELAALPGVSWVVGNSHKLQIPDLVQQMVSPSAYVDSATGSLPLIQIKLGATPSAPAPAKLLIGDIFEQTSVLVAPVLGGEAGHTRPTLKIQDGCNSRCAFCVIPYVRGRSRSLPPEEVMREIHSLVAGGYREIVLSGINLGMYGRDLVPRLEFRELLQRILDTTDVERLRVSSIEPMEVTADLIDLFASTDRIAQHFHIPLQSGSDRILAAMHRWYRAEHYARRVEQIRERLQDAAVGADVIAGFPGETEADHAATMELIRRLPFTYLHVFSFSERPGTVAAHLRGKLPGARIKRRARDLRALAAEKTATFARTHIGRHLRVLTLRPDENSEGISDGEWTNAISSNYLRVRIPGARPAGDFLDVEVCGVEGNFLLARSVSQLGQHSTLVLPQASKITCASA